jgi:cobalt-precorrin-5B (C1)-methyltransferase
MSKLASGHMDLHSRNSSIDLPQLAVWAADGGASGALQASIRAANTSQEALLLAREQGVALGDIVCARARDVALGVVPEGVDVETFAIDRQGRIIGAAP